MKFLRGKTGLDIMKDWGEAFGTVVFQRKRKGNNKSWGLSTLVISRCLVCLHLGHSSLTTLCNALEFILPGPRLYVLVSLALRFSFLLICRKSQLPITKWSDPKDREVAFSNPLGCSSGIACTSPVQVIYFLQPPVKLLLRYARVHWPLLSY